MQEYRLTKISCKRKQKRNEIQEFMCRDKTNVEHEMYDYNGGGRRWFRWSTMENMAATRDDIIIIIIIIIISVSPRDMVCLGDI